MIIGTIVLAGLAVTLAILLILGSRYLPPAADPIADQLEQLLPRIQCAQCGYPGCRPYAEAIAAGDAAINRCPPGGDETVRRLANVLGREPEPLLAGLGHASLDRVARIDEDHCIGCNLCARVCPVDAIVGISTMMHTVIADHCTGCELCLPPCPVDCIDLEPRDLPVTKATDHVIAARNDEARDGDEEWPCIRCGACADVCPARLLPQDLLRRSKTDDFGQLDILGLSDCIECGCCDVVCPSQIPLTENFRDAKHARELHERHRSLADTAQTRYLSKQERLRLEEEQTEQRRTDLKAQVAPDSRLRQEAVQAAIDRAQRRRGADDERL